MAENRNIDPSAGNIGSPSRPVGSTPTSGAGSTDYTSGGSSTGTGTGTATALSQTGQKISEVATQAKDYVSDKVAIVGEKIKDLQNADLGQLADNAKDYARKNPGQAIVISAAAGLLLGLLIRGRR